MPENLSANRIVDINLSQEMNTSFLEYAYSVIYSRTLPDARDGLKPVQRRILFQMGQMGLRPERGHVKSSRVVGEVMGKLHPHGDAAIYDAMVHLAQDFAMRVPLVDGHGNFGSPDDGPAAARYTEARLDKSAMELIADLDQDVVDFVPNYDNQFMQPEVLPAGFPNLLVNGAEGIAVGMATRIPPHNLAEVCAACTHLVDHPDATTEDLMRYVPGPDLPTGGIIIGLDGIREAYETGRGRFVTRAKAQVERVTARKQGIVITELPYQVGPEKVIEAIKDGVKNKKLQGISAVTDLSDRKQGLRLVVEIKSGINPEVVLANLYRHTGLETSYAINAVALVDGEPQTVGLKRMLEVFVSHRLEIVVRRARFQLNKRQERLHLVEGLLIAVLDIDEVIQIVRSSEDAARAAERLMMIYDLTQVQADHILSLQLRRLTKLARIELEAERDQLAREIAELQALLADTHLQKEKVKMELASVAEKLGTPRRTILLADAGAVAQTAQAMPAVATVSAAKDAPLEIPDEPCRVLLSGTGLLMRMEGAEPVSRSGPRAAHDAVVSSVSTTTRSQIGLVTADGVLHRLDVVGIPGLPRTEAAPSLGVGAPATLLAGLSPDLKVVGIVSLSDETPPIAMVTAGGTVKRMRHDHPTTQDEWSVIALDAGDRVVWAGHAADDSRFVILASDGQGLFTPADKVRPQGRTAGGMAGISLRTGSQVVGAGAVPAADLADSFIVTVAAGAGAIPGTAQGGVKVSAVDIYPTKGRGGQGVRVQRFLRGEDLLEVAAVVVGQPRAISSTGNPVELPDVDPRRDGSGSAIGAIIAAVG